MLVYADVLCCSVPREDQPLLQGLLPGAIVTAQPLSQSLAEAHPDVRWLSVMVHDSVPEAVLAWWPALRGIVTRSTGFDHLPAAALERAGVAGYALADYATASVAQLAFVQALALLRRVPEGMARTRAESWSRAGLVGRHVADCRVGVWGVGQIGSAVARLFVEAGAEVVGCDLVQRADMAALHGFRYLAPAEAFLAGLDVLSVHLPLSAATRGLVGPEALGRLAFGAVLVNTARGDIVDQDAVVAALRAGRLSGYGADVLPGEPHNVGTSRFREFTNVLITPHVGAFDERSIAARYHETGRILRALARGDMEKIDGKKVC